MSKTKIIELLERAALRLDGHGPGDSVDRAKEARSCIYQVLALVKHPHCPDNQGESWFDGHTPEES